MGLRFSKMHGAGNDFVVVDCRERPLGLDATRIRRLADRHFGIGFDQLLTIERARDPSCAFAYGIWNADGSPSGQCGNGLRCVARWLERAGLIGLGATQLQSPSGVVAVEVLADGRVGADMGVPRFAPSDIPLRAEAEADRYAIDVLGRKVEVGAVSMGNPHAVIEVDDVANAPVAVLGPQVLHAPGVGRLVDADVVPAQQELAGDAAEEVGVAVIPVGDERVIEQDDLHVR